MGKNKGRLKLESRRGNFRGMIQCPLRAYNAGGRLQLNTYVALHEVTWCMVVWCARNAPRWQQFHMASCMQPCQRCKYTTSVDMRLE